MDLKEGKLPSFFLGGLCYVIGHLNNKMIKMLISLTCGDTILCISSTTYIYLLCYCCLFGEVIMQRKLPIILDDYLEDTEQYCRGELSQEHLLNEAEWCYYNAMENPGSCAYLDYHTNSKKALKRYIDRLRSEGIKPSRDFYY